MTAQTLKGVNSLTILKRMLKHVWPKDRPDLKRRVVAAVSLLIGAKVKESLILLNFAETRMTFLP